MQLKISNQTQC